MQGLAIAVIAVGVVLVYRATRIINFAVGNMGVVGADSAVAAGGAVPRAVLGGAGVALVVGLAFGAVVDATIIRRLRKSPRVVVLVATIGVAQIAEVIAFKIPQPTEPRRALPERHQWLVDGGRRAGPRLGPLDPDHRPGHPPRAVVVPGPDHARQDGQGLCQQPVNWPVSRASAPRWSRPWSGRSPPASRPSRSSSSPDRPARPVM